MPVIANFVRTLRPAPVASAVARVLGVSRRRVLETRYGNFLANPMSRFGHKLLTAEYEPGTTAVLTRYLKPGHVHRFRRDIEGGEYEVFMNSEDILRSGILHRIALDIHHQLLERRGLSGQHLHNKMLACGYALDEGQGMPLYTFNG